MRRVDLRGLVVMSYDTTVGCCVPPHMTDRATKLSWLAGELAKTKYDLFLTPQEFFGGHVGMPDDLHIERDWLVDKIGTLALKSKTAIGVGAAVKHSTGGATEDFIYFDSDGKDVGYHRKFALPAYDDVRAKGAGQLWPEIRFEARATPIKLPSLGLVIGTIFCWEILSQALAPAYSFAGVNLIAHPIKFAPRGWPKVSPANEGTRRVVGFAQEAKSTIWEDKLLMVSRHVTMCPIAISCNTWGIGKKFMALTGHVDELLGTTKMIQIPSGPSDSYTHAFTIQPATYTGLDNLFSMAVFKQHTGSVDHFHELGQWTMHAKMRRLEAHLMGGTTGLEVMLKSSTMGRQKKKFKDQIKAMR